MKKRRSAVFIAAAAILTAALSYFLCSGYEASDAACAQMTDGYLEGRAAVFAPDEIRAGLIFYPGALVDERAYAPLMQALMQRGILCLLVQMPLDLAVLDADAADGLRGTYPQVERWMIGGHSLGGAMAAAYAAEHAQEYDALVLLGAYSAADLSDTALSVLSVYGTEDTVLNRRKYEEYRKNYPEQFTEVVIEGGCHAFFGDYGAQKGDGTPGISREMQIGMTASAVSALVDRL